MSVSDFSFVMIYINRKMLVFLKVALTTIKVVFSNAFLKSVIDF